MESPETVESDVEEPDDWSSSGICAEPYLPRPVCMLLEEPGAGCENDSMMAAPPKPPPTPHSRAMTMSRMMNLRFSRRGFDVPGVTWLNATGALNRAAGLRGADSGVAVCPGNCVCLGNCA